MSSRPNLGPKPRLGYSESRVERAAELRSDAAAIAALARDPAAGAYVIGGDLIVTIAWCVGTAVLSYVWSRRLYEREPKPV